VSRQVDSNVLNNLELGRNAREDTPLASTVYPDYKRDMYPLVPAIIGLKVVEMQKVLRLEMTMLWGKYTYHYCSYRSSLAF
jgi:hypothetical protein